MPATAATGTNASRLYPHGPDVCDPCWARAFFPVQFVVGHVRTPLIALALTAAVLAGPSAAQAADGPKPGTPAYTLRDAQNMANAYGRITGPGGQLRNPNYLPALVTASSLLTATQLLTQAANPTRIALAAGTLVPGWNVGNPLRSGWNGTRGMSKPIAFTNRYGALLRGTVYAPKPGANDPYTGKKLTGPYPGVVITPGSVQGSEGMYVWLAQDLAERGYVTMTYDVQGQGTSETFPHESGSAVPFCNPFATAKPGEMFGCPGVPFQQLSNFVVGTEDALSFFTSTATTPYANPRAAGAKVDAVNPFAKLFDRSPDRQTVTKGRTTRIAIIGHSLGAAAVSKVQGIDKRVEAVVALDKLFGPSGDVGATDSLTDGSDNVPVVPALAMQSEYGFTVAPYLLSGGISFVPAPSPSGPDPMRERATGFDDWRTAGVDSMLIVPRASTHLEYTDIPLVLPASRYGQALSSVYTQAWLDRYLKHADIDHQLLATTVRYLEPAGKGVWNPITVDRGKQLSFYYCSAYALRSGTTTLDNPDIGGVGGCAP